MEIPYTSNSIRDPVFSIQFDTKTISGIKQGVEERVEKGEHKLVTDPEYEKEEGISTLLGQPPAKPAEQRPPRNVGPEVNDEMFDAVSRVAGEKRSSVSKVRRKIRRTFKPEGNEVNGKHNQLVLCYALGVGMRAILSEYPSQRRDPPPADGKYEFAPEGSNVTPPHDLNHSFKLKVYSPEKFKAIRRHFGVSEKAITDSICGVHGDPQLVELMSNARSGAFMYATNNGHFVIKTMTKTEANFLNDSLLGDYHNHIVANPKSLLTRFLGMFRLKLHHLKAHMYFVVMGAVFNLRDKTELQFDLKGSSLGRSKKEGEKVSKDNDMRVAKKKHDVSPDQDGAFAIDLGGAAARAEFLEHARNDARFLQSKGIIDYSLMIGVTPLEQGCDESAGTVAMAAVADTTEENASSSSSSSPATVGGSRNAAAKIETVGGPVIVGCFGRPRASRGEESDQAGSCTEDEEGTCRLRLSRLNSKKFRQAPEKPPPGSSPLAQLCTYTERATTEESESEGMFSEDDGGDYSTAPSPEEPAPLRLKALSGDKRHQCSFGIIDILGTEATKHVTLQRVYKSKILGHDRLSISCVDCISYCDRFVRFLEENMA